VSRRKAGAPVHGFSNIVNGTAGLILSLSGKPFLSARSLTGFKEVANYKSIYATSRAGDVAGKKAGIFFNRIDSMCLIGIGFVL
jgi:hypothetical protein